MGYEDVLLKAHLQHSLHGLNPAAHRVHFSNEKRRGASFSHNGHPAASSIGIKSTADEKKREIRVRPVGWSEEPGISFAMFGPERNEAAQ